MRTILVPVNVDAAMPPGGSTLFTTSGTSMGTTWSARLMLPPGADGAAVTRALQGELDEIVAQMSHWDEGSLLSRYNRAPAGSWHALPPQFFAVAEYALQVAADSGGAYDPAAGALVDLWGFGARGRYDQPGFQAPQAGLVDKFLAHRVERRPVLDHAGRRLLQPGGARLDFSSVAKGYAVDRMAACLEDRSVRHFVVEAGWPALVGRGRGRAGMRGCLADGRCPARTGDRHLGRLPAQLSIWHAAHGAHARPAQRLSGGSRSGLGHGDCADLHGGRRAVHCADGAGA
jgi:thiamine biosynthesis lipoprotein ApbE